MLNFTITVTFGREPGKYFNVFVKIEQIFAISTCTVCAHVASTLHLLDYPHSLSTLGYNLLTCDYCESKSVQSKIINLTGLVDLFKPWDWEWRSTLLHDLDVSGFLYSQCETSQKLINLMPKHFWWYAVELLEQRQENAAALKLKSDRVGGMQEAEVTQLRSEIKVWHTVLFYLFCLCLNNTLLLKNKY